MQKTPQNKLIVEASYFDLEDLKESKINQKLWIPYVLKWTESTLKQIPRHIVRSPPARGLHVFCCWHLFPRTHFMLPDTRSPRAHTWMLQIAFYRALDIIYDFKLCNTHTRQHQHCHTKNKNDLHRHHLTARPASTTDRYSCKDAFKRRCHTVYPLTSRPSL